MEMELYRVPLTSHNKEQFKRGKELLSSDFFSKHYRIRTYDERYGYTYYITQERIPLAPDWFYIEVNIGEDNLRLFHEIQELALSDAFTRESLDYAFRKYPAIRSLVGFGNDFINEVFKGMDLRERIQRRYMCYPSAFWPDGYIEKTFEFRQCCNKLLDELGSGVYLNMNDFKINEELIKFGKAVSNAAQKVPSWVYKAIAIGGVICLKVLIKDAVNDVVNGLGNNNDSVGFGGECVNSENFNGDDFSSVVSSYENPSFAPSEGYNVAFMAQRETLESLGSGSQVNVTITKEPGTSNHFCIELPNGTEIHNVSGTANTIKIGQIVYKLPKLKG